MLVQMTTFGGYHALNASKELQKKLQEEAMADNADVVVGMAGMDIKDDADKDDPGLPALIVVAATGQDDAMSIGSSASETQLAMLHAQIRHLQNQNHVMAMTTNTLSEQLAQTSADACPEQMKHNTIISNHVFTGALGAMQGGDLDIDALWWMVQWGNEYLARFKRDAHIPAARKQAHARYKKWTADTKQKQMAGFSASLCSSAGDDFLDQSQND